MLGNVIGVMCVVALVNIGISGRLYIQGSLTAIGQHLIFVQPRYEAHAENPSSHWRPLSMSDVRAIDHNCPASNGVCPEVEATVQAAYGHSHTGAPLIGVLPNYVLLRNWRLAKGAMFTGSDNDSAEHLCVLGQKVAEKLFGNVNPLRETIHINRQAFTVAGVLEKKARC